MGVIGGFIEVRSKTSSYSKEPNMDNCARCPNCYVVPEPKFEGGLFWLMCEQHGHMACGAQIETAVINWNRYVDLVARKVA